MAASCMLVTNPSMSGPTLMLHNIDSSNGTVPLKGDFLKILGPKRGAAHGLGCIPIWGGFYFGRVVDFCDVWLRSEEAQPLPSSVWGSRTEGDYPYCSSLRRLHPRAWRRRPSAPSSGQNAGVSTAALFLLPPFLPRPPAPLPLSVASSKDALSISCTPGVKLVEEQAGGRDFFVRGEERRKSGKQKQLKGRGGRNGKEGEEHLTRRQKDNFGQAALFKVKAWFAFQKRRPVVLPPQGHHRTNQRVI